MIMLIVLAVAAIAVAGGILMDRRRGSDAEEETCTCGDGAPCAVHDAMMIW